MRIDIRHILMMAAVGVAASACQSDDCESAATTTAQPVEVRASIENAATTRSTTTTDITDGTYYFSFPWEEKIDDNTTEYTCRTLTCQFFTEDGTSVGRVYTPSGSLLQWISNDLPSSLGYKFRLDNVYGNNTATGYFYKEKVDHFFESVLVSLADTKYEAALIPTDGSTPENDVVWGTTADIETSPGSSAANPTLSFTLTHRMAQVYAYFDASAFDNIEGLNEEDNVTVELTNIAYQPATFNRTDGTVALGTDPERKNITLYNGKLSSLKGGETGKLILPPQSLFEGNTRQRLRVTIGDRAFSSVLPQGMLYENTNIGATLEFLAGVCLKLQISALKTKVENLEIEFNPVLVEDWIDIGTYDVQAKQGGIYESTDITKAIEAYNAYVTATTDADLSTLKTQLERYGRFVYNSDGTIMKYVVNIFEHITKPATLFNKNDDKLTLEIDMNGYSVTDGETKYYGDNAVAQLISSQN